MCSDRILLAAALSAAIMLSSCGSYRKLSGIRNGTVEVGLSIPSDHNFEKARQELMTDVTIEGRKDENTGEPLIMNAIKDEVTGEMVATDIISASTVVARFRNVAERFGKVVIEFDITVPGEMMESGWKLKFAPLMKMSGDSTWLDPVYITGRKYREEQMRGYLRYQAFLASIVTDSSDFVRMSQLELFIRRHFPKTYAMKRDSSFVPDPVAENVFGVSQREALEHYTRRMLQNRNERRKLNSGKMFRKYVKDPFADGSIRLDTVIMSDGGNLVYRYVQDVRSRPGLKKIEVSLYGTLYEDGVQLCSVDSPRNLDFYVSSLSSLADMTPRYITKIVERRVSDNTHAFIDFESGSCRIDTLLYGNAEELGRIRKCVNDIIRRDEFELDSLMVTASCSPEGNYGYNSSLAYSRAESVIGYLKDYIGDAYAGKLHSGAVGENWEQFARIASNDSVISDRCRKHIIEAAQMSFILSERMASGKKYSGKDVCGDDIDRMETGLSSFAEYRYLREKIYPRLRSVRFDFYLHRKGMLKDTVQTTELDSVYLAGVEAIREMDYRRAVELLRPYHDYNTALAYLSCGYDHSAFEDLSNIPVPSARTDYLLAVVLSRLGRKDEAVESYKRSVEADPSMAYRANLDPELSELIHLNY